MYHVLVPDSADIRLGVEFFFNVSNSRFKDRTNKIFKSIASLQAVAILRIIVIFGFAYINMFSPSRILRGPCQR